MMVRTCTTLTVLCVLAAAVGCSRRDDAAVPPEVPPATSTEASPLVPAATPRASVPEGVRVIDVMEDASRVRLTWLDCDHGDATLSQHTTQLAIQNLVARDETLVVIDNDENQVSTLRVFDLGMSEDACAVTPRTSFGEGGTLVTKGTVVDAAIVGESLVIVGSENAALNLTTGAYENRCDNLPALTRLRLTNDGLVGRSGNGELVRVDISSMSCSVSPWVTLQGDERPGMNMAVFDDGHVMSNVLHDNRTVGFAYFEDGAMRWRYEPSAPTPRTRVDLVTSLVRVGDYGVMVRGIQRHMDVIARDGTRAGSLNFESIDGKSMLQYPAAFTSYDDTRMIGVQRTFQGEGEPVLVSLGVVRIHPN